MPEYTPSNTVETSGEKLPTAYKEDTGPGTSVAANLDLASRRERYRPKVAVVAPPPTAAMDADRRSAELAPGRATAQSTPGWILLASALFTLLVLSMLLMLAVSAGINVSVVTEGFTVRFISLFVEAAPFLLLGSLVAGLIDSFVSPDHIARLVPRNRVLGVLMGTFAGFVFPVCECGVVPVVRQLYSKKLPAAVGLAFLLAAPVMNPVVLLSTWTVFGFGPVLIGRYAITALVAIVAGLIFSMRGLPIELRQPMQQVGEVNPVAGGGTVQVVSPRASMFPRVRSALQVAVDEFFDMGRFLVVGSVLAAGMQTIVSQNLLAAVGQGPFASVFIMQVVAFVLSVCSTVDAFLALAFTGAFTTGSILAFLTFGPMVDIKTTTMFLGVFRRKTVAWLTLLPLALTALAGIALNLLGLN